MIIDKQELRRFAKAATFGPWESVKRTEYDGSPFYLIQTQVERNGWEIAEIRMDVPHDNAAFIAAANPSTILALLDELEQVTNNRDMWQEQCRSQSAALQEVRANEKQAMAYLHDVREIVGGYDYPEMIQRIRYLESCKRDADSLRSQVETLTGWYSNSLDIIRDVTEAIPGVTYMDPPDGGDVSIPEQVRRMAIDAERYRWLRMANWWDSPLCVVRNPKEQAKPGTDCPSMNRLDEAVDKAMQEQKQ